MPDTIITGGGGDGGMGAGLIIGIVLILVLLFGGGYLVINHGGGGGSTTTINVPAAPALAAPKVNVTSPKIVSLPLGRSNAGPAQCGPHLLRSRYC